MSNAINSNTTVRSTAQGFGTRLLGLGTIILDKSIGAVETAGKGAGIVTNYVENHAHASDVMNDITRIRVLKSAFTKEVDRLRLEDGLVSAISQDTVLALFEENPSISDGELSALKQWVNESFMTSSEMVDFTVKSREAALAKMQKRQAEKVAQIRKQAGISNRKKSSSVDDEFTA